MSRPIRMKPFLERRFNYEFLHIHPSTHVNYYVDYGTTFAKLAVRVAKGGYDGVIYLTDMFGSFPVGFNKPTLWVSTTAVDKAPFGKVINIKLETQED